MLKCWGGGSGLTYNQPVRQKIQVFRHVTLCHQVMFSSIPSNVREKTNSPTQCGLPEDLNVQQFCCIIIKSCNLYEGCKDCGLKIVNLRPIF